MCDVLTLIRGKSSPLSVVSVARSKIIKFFSGNSRVGRDVYEFLIGVETARLPCLIVCMASPSCPSSTVSVNRASSASSYTPDDLTEVDR